MKAGQLILLILFCIIIGAAGWIVKKKQDKSWEKSENRIGQEVFKDFPLNQIEKITIQSNEKAVELQKVEDYWVVSNNFSYYADFVKIANFLKKLMDLKVTLLVDIDKKDLGRLELNNPDAESATGLLVEFFDRNNSSLGKLIMGKNHTKKASATSSPYSGGGGYADGRYVYHPQRNLVALVSETFSSISDDAGSWLDKTFIKVDKVKTASMTKAGNPLWTIDREGEQESLSLEGDLADDEELSTSKISSFESALRYPRFNEVADPVVPVETYGFEDGWILRVESFDGLIYTLSIGKKTESGDFPLKLAVDFQEPPMLDGPEDESEEDRAKREAEHKEKIAEAREKFNIESTKYTNWVYLMPSHSTSNLTIDRKDFIKKGKEPEDKGQVHRDDKEAGDDEIEFGPQPNPEELLDEIEDSSSPAAAQSVDRELELPSVKAPSPPPEPPQPPLSTTVQAPEPIQIDLGDPEATDVETESESELESESASEKQGAGSD